MLIQILISKKGTKVVTASQLHEALELEETLFQKDTSSWISNIYSFKDGIRSPRRMKDYAERKLEDCPVKDYYLSVELAKFISLNSQSRKRKKLAMCLS